MARPGKVPFGIKFSFAFGQLGDALYLGLTLNFLQIFYNQALGLSNSLYGLAYLIAMVSDAATDPIIGALSDGWRSRWGRRHPFLYFSAIPFGLSFFFLFNPPSALTAIPPGQELPAQLPLFLWITFWAVVSRTCFTLYAVPHLALGAELSSDYNERASVFSFNAIAGFFFGPTVAFVTWTFFLDKPTVRARDLKLVEPQLDAANYFTPMLLAAVGIAAGILVCAHFTRKEISHLHQPADDAPRFGVRIMVIQMLEACRNRSYLYLLIGFFFLSLTLGIGETMGLYMGTYFWEFEPDQLRWFSWFQTMGYVSGAFLAPLLIRRFEKRPVAIGVVAVYSILVPLPVLGRFAGVLPENGDPLLLRTLLIQTIGWSFCLAALNVCIMSMLADIADQHELETGQRQEGIFYAARQFFSKASNGLAHVLGSLALDLFVRLPIGVTAGEVAPDVLWRMGLTAGPLAAIGCTLSIFCYGRYRMSRADHGRIRERLADRARRTAGVRTVTLDAGQETANERPQP
jgi:Na+/melibiose symporter-like transporter